MQSTKKSLLSITLLMTCSIYASDEKQSIKDRVDLLLKPESREKSLEIIAAINKQLINPDAAPATPVEQLLKEASGEKSLEFLMAVNQLLTEYRNAESKSSNTDNG